MSNKAILMLTLNCSDHEVTLRLLTLSCNGHEVTLRHDSLQQENIKGPQDLD